MALPITSAPWLQTVAFHIGSAPVTNLAIVRTVLILALTYLCVRVSVAGWKRAERSRPNFNQSHLYVLSRITTGAIIAIGVFVALAFLGLDLSKLTLIASALSVGVGFGLKNIIDNVSSGVVLLFERSIRVGDWVVVGTTAGLVTKINVRSTVIQTWDQADVIVPNADLITAQVTNWTLTTPSGRIRIPLGLAYGTDTDWVRSLLLDIANAHPEVITGGSAPKPIVLFFGFGESTLRFELRCFVKDIMQQLTVVSELNLAIAHALREHGVEVPYPQRELHIKSWTQTHGSEGGASAPP
ncbi:MAG: mechanosensitive ion channel [Gammaproteobacteria bacterium]|nr:mechanosensitive ion channel [Gammaproteobacteria bacterium]MDH3466074.1 mechanosensitive ion channel [Gammaproteobacteria bacterium]